MLARFQNSIGTIYLCTLTVFKFALPGDCFHITVLHTNDVHAHFEPDSKGFGGAARRMTAVKRMRETHPNVLLLDAGDQFQGTIWYSLLKWEPIADVMNALGYDAMALGNHEFDEGPEGLLPFVKKAQFPVISANINATGSTLEGVLNSYVKHIADENVGIVGYTTTETAEVSKPGPLVRFHDEIASLKQAVKALQQLGINKIVAVGHSGISKDRQICKEVPGVDVVVGGHTNTFLHTGEQPSTEIPQGPYPEVYHQSGNPCLVVQDYAYGKYLGFLQVQFDEQGTVQAWSGNPILLDDSWKEDPDMLTVMSPYVAKLEAYKRKVVGRSAVGLDGQKMSCRQKECNLGNLVTDAAVHAYYSKSNFEETNTWSPVGIGIINAASLANFISAPGKNITLADVYNLFPYGTTLKAVQLKGKYIREALEHSIQGYAPGKTHGKFLQISGMKVVYDLSKPVGE